MVEKACLLGSSFIPKYAIRLFRSALSENKPERRWTSKCVTDQLEGAQTKTPNRALVTAYLCLRCFIGAVWCGCTGLSHSLLPLSVFYARSGIQPAPAEKRKSGLSTVCRLPLSHFAPSVKSLLGLLGALRQEQNMAAVAAAGGERRWDVFLSSRGLHL